MTCEHEPWLHVPGDHNGYTTPPREVGGLFTEKAYACRKCGVLYIPLEAQVAKDAADAAFESEWEARKAERKAIDVPVRATKPARVPVPCHACNGTGRRALDPEGACRLCFGKRVLWELPPTVEPDELDHEECDEP